MPHEIYRKLAQRLDTIPNGFPATESGVELRLLEKMFTPEEAALAVVMLCMPRFIALKMVMSSGPANTMSVMCPV